MPQRADDAPAGDLVAGNEDTFAKLLHVLRRSAPGQLVFVELGPPSLRKELVEELRRSLPDTSFCYVDLSQHDSDRAIVFLLRSLLEPEGSVDVLLLDGVESRMQDPEQTRDTLEQLNLAREALSALGPAVVFLVPPYIIDELRTRALNLWSWRAYHLPLAHVSVRRVTRNLPNVPTQEQTQVIAALGRGLAQARAAGMPFHDLLHAAALPYARALSNAGRYREALEVLDALVDDAKQDVDALDQAEIDEMRAQAHAGMGELEPALHLLERALAARMQNPERVSGTLAATLLELGLVSSKLGLHTDAELRLLDSLRRFDTAFEGQALGAALARSLLADVYLETGRLREARASLEAAHDAFENIKGSHHPETARLALQLGKVARALGDYRTAEAMVEQAIQRYTALLGSAHPQTLYAQLELAGNYMESLCPDAARRLFEQSLPVIQQQFGDQHPSVLAIREILDELSAE